MKYAVSIAGGGEYSLCGLAFDAHDSGDEPEPVHFAVGGQLVTCRECRAMIDYVRTFKGYRAPKDVDDAVN